jgi:hypothetical protein
LKTAKIGNVSISGFVKETFYQVFVLPIEAFNASDDRPEINSELQDGNE